MSSRGLGDRREGELDGHELAVVFAVAVLDGVDHRLADGDADPVDRVLVEAGELADAVADDLDEVQHLEVAVDLQADGAAARQHAARAMPAGAADGSRRADGANGRTAVAVCRRTRVNNILNRIPSRMRML